MRSVRNRNGFTLIELIATIAIISILSVIAIFTYGKIQKNSENKAEELTYKSVMKSAASYANEYYNDSKYWVYRENNDTETFCVPVLDLVNKGFLKQDDIKNISYSFILLTRGFSNKTIISEEYDKEGICGGAESGGAKLQLVKVTTSSASVSARCDDNNGLVNYTYGLFDKNDNEINNYVSKDNSYKFSGLTKDTEYSFKVKCNYQNSYSTDYSDELKRTIGSTDLSFKIGNVKKDSDKIYKEVSINYTSNNIYESENAKYYFRVNSNGNKSADGVYKCGNGSSPSNCESDTTTILESGYWYKSDSAKVKLHIYNNSSIYARIWDGEIYSTNKSLQVVLPTNPYVNISIDHKLYDSYNGKFLGEEDNIINYNIDNWMSMPDISWNIYGGYETNSKVYYIDTGNDNCYYDERKSNESNYPKVDSGVNCTKSSCKFDGTKIGNNGGMQQIKIVVTNEITRDKTIIYINVNIDKKAPILEIDNPTKGNWTNQNITIKLNYSDSHSGIDKSSIQWKDNKNNKNFEYVSYDENNGDTWYDEGDRKGWYRICDKAGNCTEASTNIRIDRTSPTLNISNSSGGNWTNKNITTKLTYFDSASGINASSLAWKDNKNNTNWTSISNNNTSNYSDTWSDEGEREGWYRICDKAGNCTDKSTNIKIDKTAPSKPDIDNPTKGNWSKGNFSLTLSSSDSYSGIAYYQYTYNANATTTGNNHNTDWVTYSNSNKNSFTTTKFTSERNQLVYVRVCDNVGNCSDRKSTQIKIDTTPPEILEIYNPYGNKWSKGNFSLTLSSRDNLSGIAYYQYTYNANASTTGTNHNTTWVTYNNSDKEIFKTIPFTAQRNQPVYVRACDNVGNCSDRKSTQIKIDTTPPTITLKNYSGGDWTYGSVKVLIKFSDDMSGINAKSLKWHDNAKQTEWKLIDNENTSSREETWSSPGDRIGTYQICDNAGNCNEASTSIKIMEYKEMPKKTNGSWWIWNVPGYVGSQTSCKSYMRWIGDGNSPYVTVDSNKCVVNNKEGSDFATAHLVGVTNDNYTVYIKVRDGKMVETSGSNSNSNLFIKIYIQKEAINGSSSVASYKCYDGSNIEKCNLDTIKINNTTYYGVWIKDTCKQDGKTCPPDGVALH